MRKRIVRHWQTAAVALSAALACAAAGCGGKGEGSDDAIVTVPEPVAAAGGAAAGGASGTAPAPAASAESKPAEKPAETLAVKAAGWGTLKGKVTFAGDPPLPRVFVAKGAPGVKDAQVCAKNEIKSERLVVDPGTKGVRYALVYVPRPTAVNPEAESAAKSTPIEFDQKGCVFEPHVLALMKGAKVSIKSADPVGHNVNVKLINLRQNFSILPGAAPVPLDVKVDEKKPGEVVCDIHPWMKAWWMVTTNPYFAVTDAKGSYEIKNVPAGTQKVVVWQEAVHPGFVTASSGDPVTIQAGGETTQDFTIDASKVKPE
jgi:hypothetical protein